jgi:hypothetical protein
MFCVGLAPSMQSVALGIKVRSDFSEKVDHLCRLATIPLPENRLKVEEMSKKNDL